MKLFIFGAMAIVLVSFTVSNPLGAELLIHYSFEVEQPGFLFKGMVDEFYYYDSAITNEEIKSLYDEGAAVEPGGKSAVTWGNLKSLHL